MPEKGKESNDGGERGSKGLSWGEKLHDKANDIVINKNLNKPPQKKKGNNNYNNEQEWITRTMLSK